MALRLLLLLLTATILISQAQGIGNLGMDCCLKYSEKLISVNRLTSYTLQEPESGCLLRAVVFTTKKNKKICASPTDADVQKMMQNLDKRVRKDKKRQPPRYRGRPKRQKQQKV
ncbi:C-C motif chemokine 21 [Melopsittacus undulatus]|uniref:C-C motif chemokine n=1 Tax=Melopsittacus undulatus TaxID=13146 RepID=A0A8V5GMJ8_MELUD|nr:C-C motif chemokine 21 [Melopsittacus undulatus]